jgi:hypothetical protein
MEEFVQDYSIYILGRSGRLVREIEIDCVNDNAAIDLAQRWVDGYDVELWQLDRLVARFRGIGKDHTRYTSGSSMKPDSLSY